MCRHGWRAGGTPAVKPASLQQPPALLARAAAEVEIGAQDDEVASECDRAGAPVCRARPAPPSHSAPGGPARVEMRAHHVEQSARQLHRRRQRDAPLQHERQLERACFAERQIREDRVAAVARPAPFRMDGTYRRLSRSSRAISTMSARGTVRGGKRAGGPADAPARRGTGCVGTERLLERARRPALDVGPAPGR